MSVTVNQVKCACDAGNDDFSDLAKRFEALKRGK